MEILIHRVWSGVDILLFLTSSQRMMMVVPVYEALEYRGCFAHVQMAADDTSLIASLKNLYRDGGQHQYPQPRGPLQCAQTHGGFGWVDIIHQPCTREARAESRKSRTSARAALWLYTVCVWMSLPTSLWIQAHKFPRKLAFYLQGRLVAGVFMYLLQRFCLFLRRMCTEGWGDGSAGRTLAITSLRT